MWAVFASRTLRRSLRERRNDEEQRLVAASRNPKHLWIRNLDRFLPSNEVKATITTTLSEAKHATMIFELVVGRKPFGAASPRRWCCVFIHAVAFPINRR